MPSNLHKHDICELFCGKSILTELFCEGLQITLRLRYTYPLSGLRYEAAPSLPLRPSFFQIVSPVLIAFIVLLAFCLSACDASGHFKLHVLHPGARLPVIRERLNEALEAVPLKCCFYSIMAHTPGKQLSVLKEIRILRFSFRSAGLC